MDSKGNAMEVDASISELDSPHNAGAAHEDARKGPIHVEILGPVNAVSRMTAQVLDAAIRELDLMPDKDICLDFVRDSLKIAESGVYWTPAVRVNGTLKCSGRVPSLKEVRSWLR